MPGLAVLSINQSIIICGQNNYLHPQTLTCAVHVCTCSDVQCIYIYNVHVCDCVMGVCERCEAIVHEA